MRRWLPVVVLSAVFCGAGPPAAGQSFTASMPESVRIVPLGQEGVFEGTMTNVSAQPLTMALIRTLSDLPAGWTSSLCFEACYPPWVDTVLTTPEWGSSPLLPGETRAFSLHVYPVEVHGTGTVRIIVRSVRDPADSAGFLLTTTSLSTAVAAEPVPDPASLRVYPNPVNGTAAVDAVLPERAPARISVLDVRGREVVRLHEGVLEAGRRTFRFETGGLASGIYFCRMIAGTVREVRRVVVLK